MTGLDEIAASARKLIVGCAFFVGGLAMTVSRNDGSNGLAMTCVRHCEPKISELVPMCHVLKKVYTFYINTKICLQFKYNPKIYFQRSFFLGIFF